MTRSNAEWLRLIATWLPAYGFQLNEAANELDRRSPMSREARIAELERAIEHIKAMSWSVPSDKRSERFMAINYELARLHNEVTSDALAQSDAEPATRLDIDAAVKAGLATRNPAPDAAPSSYSNTKTVTIGPAALAQSDAESDALQNDLRELLEILGLPTTAQPRSPHAVFQDALEELRRRQSDAEPWRCPCGIPPENHHICSAGTCWWCLADRVKAQSGAKPDASQLLWKQLDQQLFDLVELARDRRDASQISESEWLHPRGALVNEFSKRISAPPRPNASAGLIEAAEWHEEQQAKGKLLFHDECANFFRSLAADRSGK